MKCEKCGKNEATVYYEQTVNGVTHTMRLCPVCAQSAGLESFPAMGFWGEPFGGSSLWREVGSAAERRCPSCGTTERTLRKSGRVGCADCYAAFRDVLTPYLQKVHGATRHIGAAPAPAPDAPAPQQTDPLAALRTQLKAAVEREDYEQAARLRDEIRRKEGEDK